MCCNLLSTRETTVKQFITVRYLGTMYFVKHKNVWHRFAAIIFGGAPARKGLMEKALLLYVCSMSGSSESNVDCVAKSPSYRRRVDVI